MAVLGSWDLNEVTMREFGFSSCGNLQVHAAIRSYLVVYLPLIWLTMSSKSQRTSSSAISMIASLLRPAITTLYSASLLVARNLRAQDCSIMDPSGVVRTIPTPALSPFDAPSTFRIHPFKRLLYGEGPSVNLGMKSAKTCPLIAVLGSKVTPRGLISVTHFAILQWP